jgi:hypothetical protein
VKAVFIVRSSWQQQNHHRTSAGTSKPFTQGHFKIGHLVAYRPELSSNYSQLADELFAALRGSD